MPLKDLLTFVNIRKDWRFFLHRFVIGSILTLVLFCPGKIEVSAITSAVGEQKLLLCALVLIMMLLISLIHKISTGHRFFKKIQAEGILFCQTVTHFVRSMMIIGLSSLAYSIILEDSLLLPLTIFVIFLVALEMITYNYFVLKSFEHDNPEQFKGIFYTEENVGDSLQR